MERGKYLTQDEIATLCNKYCGARTETYCEGCPILREGRRDRTDYYKKYYLEKTKKKRQEARHENKS